ncbi:hypothetical protein WR25_22673 [Diploscapter pachys]|uniref:Uncharacterized protein n=1 Tax=Diploscapter pachys TaxID=2018661 RepID=A0A2A2M4M3_9BILA|nr:hypothetical protein WR25_22673 [Diploscapter pachys]
MVVQRAMDRAIGHAALRAAPGLILRRRRRVACGDFGEILRPRGSVALGGIGLRPAYELQHGIAKGAKPCRLTMPTNQRITTIATTNDTTKPIAMLSHSPCPNVAPDFSRS